VLKTLGFSGARVLGLIILESLIISGIGGITGLLLVKLLTMGGDPTNGLLPGFYLSYEAMGAGLLISLLLGTIAGIVPGMSAMRLGIVEAFRRI
jgi:putative ABC transport system permease protein